ncbi:AMP-binding enzyme, partial [Francisella tularensis]|uniref:AMP-binding enzyme n=1 Tax=Francisella tularensis TaxID=263 RepID=UPI0023ADED71|nr:hypothetical protein [Francisella tularensis subsp. holarctica]
DDFINVTGYRKATEAIVAALNTHPVVAEIAVVGMPHEIKGEAIYFYCILKEGKCDSKEALDVVRKSLIKYVRQEIGPVA